MQGEIVALVHSSHPGGLLAEWGRFSGCRCRVICRGGWGLPGTIHKFRCVPHLTGRRFEHGVTDCYTLFQDACIIWQRGLRCGLSS